ncbi:MAG: hypothetical protein PWP52_2348 [Bacteroidales bacterium]|nr:hypothetical protein [Bacteroidales bacterium]
MDDIENRRQRCDIFSRVVGYVRRIDSWNYGKQSEFHDRILFKTDINEKNND